MNTLRVVVLLVSQLCWLGRASAYHDPTTPSREDSAYQLRSREWLLGPLLLAVGLWRIELGTHVAPWLIGAAYGKLMPNLELGFDVFSDQRFALRAAGGLYYVNSRKLVDDPVVSLFVFPLDAAFSWRARERHTVTLRARYVAATSDADANANDVTLRGGAIADNAQVHASWEWRLTRVSALLCVLRYLPYQGDPVLDSSLTFDAQTTGTLSASYDTKAVHNSVAGTVSGLFSWQHFNLRVGVSYGALFLNGPGIVLPLKYPYPDINLYWRL